MPDNIDETLMAALKDTKSFINGQAVNHMVGRSIREIDVRKSEDGSRVQLMIVAPDFETFVMTVAGKKLKLIAAYNFQGTHTVVGSPGCIH